MIAVIAIGFSSLMATAAGQPGSSNGATVDVCHVPPGNSDAARNITINQSALPAHDAHGDSMEPCQGDTSEGPPADPPSSSDDQITVCHVPPGNLDAAHNITINQSSWPAHEAHGDSMEPCQGDPDEAENQPPTAAFTSDTENLTVSLDGSSSSDSDGTITSYSWDLGDGNTTTGVSPTHAYAANGTYTITLNVTDDDNATDETSQDVTVRSGLAGPGDPPVEQTPPVAAWNATCEELACSFDGSPSSDADGTITNWTWTYNPTFFGETAEHTFDESGTYNVTLTVTDDDGLTGSLTEEVTVAAATTTGGGGGGGGGLAASGGGGSSPPVVPTGGEPTAPPELPPETPPQPDVGPIRFPFVDGEPLGDLTPATLWAHVEGPPAWAAQLTVGLVLWTLLMAEAYNVAVRRPQRPPQPPERVSPHWTEPRDVPGIQPEPYH